MERDETKLTMSIEGLKGEIQELNKSREEDGNNLAEAIEGLKDLTKNVGEEGERELARSPFALAISGLAAGLSMVFSLVAEGLLHAVILFVVLGRQQLFTENTLTVTEGSCLWQC
jgi:formate/nitrite transporter FocA (FNT family)